MRRLLTGSGVLLTASLLSSCSGTGTEFYDAAKAMVNQMSNPPHATATDYAPAALTAQ
jgi:hypothetical protein